jgi:hypothetical protein
MKVEITIKIEVDEDSFCEHELYNDINASFEERTGCEIQELEIEVD